MFEKKFSYSTQLLSYLRLCNAMLGQFDDGEIAPADGLFDLVEPDAQRSGVRNF